MRPLYRAGQRDTCTVRSQPVIKIHGQSSIPGQFLRLWFEQYFIHRKYKHVSTIHGARSAVSKVFIVQDFDKTVLIHMVISYFAARCASHGVVSVLFDPHIDLNQRCLSIYRCNRLTLSRSRRDSLKHVEISVLRHIRCAVLRKKTIEQPNFTNEHVI